MSEQDLTFNHITTPITYNTYSIDDLASTSSKSIVWITDKVENFLREYEEKRTNTSYETVNYTVTTSNTAVMFLKDPAVTEQNFTEEYITFSANTSTNVLSVNLVTSAGDIVTTLLDVDDYLRDEDSRYEITFADRTAENVYTLKVRSFEPTGTIQSLTVNLDETAEIYTTPTVNTIDRTVNTYTMNSLGVQRISSLSAVNLSLLFPEKFRILPEVQDFIRIMERIYFEIKQKSEGVILAKDPDNFPIQYASDFANYIGLNINDLAQMTQGSVRQQIAYATEWYKIKGTELSLDTYMATVGLLKEIIPLWTSTYTVDDLVPYEDLDKTHINHPSYNTPHVILEFAHKGGVTTEQLLQNAAKSVDSIIPVNIVADREFGIYPDSIDPDDSIDPFSRVSDHVDFYRADRTLVAGNYGVFQTANTIITGNGEASSEVADHPVSAAFDGDQLTYWQASLTYTTNATIGISNNTAQPPLKSFVYTAKHPWTSFNMYGEATGSSPVVLYSGVNSVINTPVTVIVNDTNWYNKYYMEISGNVALQSLSELKFNGGAFSKLSVSTSTITEALYVVSNSTAAGPDFVAHDETMVSTIVTPTGFKNVRCVEYGNGMWVAGMESPSNTLAYSYDGINWTGLGSTIFTAHCNFVKYGGGMWVAAGTGTNNVAYSNDGINWTGINTATLYLEATQVAYGGTSGWMIASPGKISWSPDGINWTNVKTTAYAQNESIGFSPTSGVGLGRWLHGNREGFAMGYSDDNGASWSSVVGVPLNYTHVRGYLNGRWVVAVGSSGGAFINPTRCILWSDDEWATYHSIPNDPGGGLWLLLSDIKYITTGTMASKYLLVGYICVSPATGRIAGTECMWYADTLTDSLSCLVGMGKQSTPGTLTQIAENTDFVTPTPSANPVKSYVSTQVYPSVNSLAYDGNTSTSWVGANYYRDFLGISSNSVLPKVSRIRLYPTTAFGGYEVVDNTGLTTNVVASGTVNSAGVWYDIDIPSYTYNINSIALSPIMSANIAEIEFYQYNDLLISGTPKASSAVIGHPASYAFDNNDSTWWEGTNSINSTIGISANDVQYVNAVEFKAHEAFGPYTIIGSSNSAMETLYAGTCNTTSWQTITFNALGSYNEFYLDIPQNAIGQGIDELRFINQQVIDDSAYTCPPCAYSVNDMNQPVYMKAAMLDLTVPSNIRRASWTDIPGTIVYTKGNLDKPLYNRNALNYGRYHQAQSIIDNKIDFTPTTNDHNGEYFNTIGYFTEDDDLFYTSQFEGKVQVSGDVNMMAMSDHMAMFASALKDEIGSCNNAGDVKYINAKTVAKIRTLGTAACVCNGGIVDPNTHGITYYKLGYETDGVAINTNMTDVNNPFFYSRYSSYPVNLSVVYNPTANTLAIQSDLFIPSISGNLVNEVGYFSANTLLCITRFSMTDKCRKSNYGKYLGCTISL